MSIPLHQTKHFRVAQKLRQMVMAMPVGEKIPTQTQVMQQFNTSQATVERALAKLRDEGLIGREPGRKRLVRVAYRDPGVRQISIIRPEWVSEVYEGIGRSLVAEGKQQQWSFKYATYASMAELEIDRLAGSADGVALMTTSEPCPAGLAKDLAQPRRPTIVLQDHIGGGHECWSVMSDDAKIAEMAVDHLAELGHRRIALMLPTLETPPMRASLEGYRRSMRRHGLAPDESLELNVRTPHQMFPQHAGYAYLCDYFHRFADDGSPPPFTAVICSTIQMAMALMRLLRERGLSVPGDVSVVASDGVSEMGPFFDPPLTTLRTEITDYGRFAIDLLEAQFAGESQPQQVLIPPRFHPGESTGPVR